MPRPRTTSDEAILGAARAVLIDLGPAAPISAIARKAGLSGPAILGRFGSRAELIQAALAPPSLAPVLAALHSEPQVPGFSGQLEATLLTLGRWVQQATPGLLLLRMSPAHQRPRGQVVDGQPRLLPSLTIWLARAQARGLVTQGDAQTLASAVLRTMQGHALAPLLEPGTAPPELAPLVEQLVALLLPPVH
jgi:AcrR family transcriptional regulator